TVAKREGAGDMEAGSLGQQTLRQNSLALGRSGRQPQCTELVEESLTAAQHQGRQNVPVSLADSSEPTSCPVPDVETSLEGSVGSTSEMKSGPHSGSLSVQERPASSGKATGGEDKEDTSDNGSDILTLKESRDSGKPKPECELFMSGCDRCEERFRGDCGGASQARGRLLGRNREDYICPKCTVLQVQDETNAETTDHQETKFTPGDADDTDFTSIGTVEQKSSEDRKIKRKIEKGVNPGGKKKLKLCQPVVEAPGTSRCTLPGSSSVVQSSLAYCSKDIIFTHAAATMKCPSSGKEQKPKPKEKIVAKFVLFSCVTRTPALSLAARKADGRAEETAAVASASKRRARPVCLVDKRPSPRHLAPKKSPPFANVAAAKPAIKKAPSSFKGTISQKPWLSATPSGGASTVGHRAASKQFPGSAALAGAIGKPVATSLPVASPVPGHLGTWSPAQSQPSSQIRHNIRLSLKEILWKRVSDSDDLIITEKEVGNITLHLEKEMFNLFQVTDVCYMRKYRSLLFNLKDPKNQVCVVSTYCSIPHAEGNLASVFY
ncbi:PREDICTED: death-inducer obliterator 1-like, partial [Galeopterus variegatus]|uniref:Death-inducer obliterator 1-like n=1 Tax=Galeopterus variegatus TaxID=482537 RepID=A0ABM0Q0Z8_GALVR